MKFKDILKDKYKYMLVLPMSFIFNIKVLNETSKACELKLPRVVPLSPHHSVAGMTFPLREPHLDPIVRHGHMP